MNPSSSSLSVSPVESLPGLQGKLAIVTGSTSGIGLAIAQQLVASGCYVVINGRSQESCSKACHAIQGDENLKIPIAADVGTAEGVQTLVTAMEHIRKEQKNEHNIILPPVSILINNVGIFEPKDFVDITDEEWINYHQVNVMSGIRLCRIYLPLMLQHNWGRIIFISSEAGIRTLPHMIPYSVTKAAQIAAARGLAQTTKGTNVTVNSVLPGPTWTTGVEKYMQGFAASKGLPLEQAIASYFQEYEPTSLLQRFLQPKEVAAVTAFLCSELASGINGASQRVEGGIIHHI
jgi:NAD(P)-dependent dehydrogenase (short-subunit alcohol dehydrogenase family)